MSNYLHSLINRIHPPQDAVRPRLAARFEPATTLGGALDVADLSTGSAPSAGDINAWQSSLPAQTTSIDRSGLSMTAEPSEQRLPVGAQKDAPESPVSWPRTQAQRAQPVAPMPFTQADMGNEMPREVANSEAHFQRIRRTVTPHVSVSLAPLVTEPAAPVGARGEESVVSRAPAPMETEPQPPIRPSRQERLAQTTQAQTGLRPVGQQAAATMPTAQLDARTGDAPVGTSATATRRPPVAPLLTPIDRRSDSRSALAPDSDPVVPPVRAQTMMTPRLAEPPPVDTRLSVHQAVPPVIRVTIGRIEVRATQAQSERARPQPAAPSRPSLPQPALSLDAYLKQRGGSR